MGDVSQTLSRVLRSRVAVHPERTFVSFPNTDTTYGQLFERAAAFAKGLVAVGLKPGQHVAILMPNSPSYVELMFATYLAGGVLVPINARFRRRELGFVLADCDAEILITTDAVDEYTDFTSLLADSLPGLRESSYGSRGSAAGAPRLRHIFLEGVKRVPFADPLQDLVEAGIGIDDETLAAATSYEGIDSLAMLLYTSGTTSNPKGCELTHGALLRSWSAYADLVGFEANESMWTPCPFFHVAGIGVTVAALVRGAAMMSMTHFEPSSALEHIRRNHAEHLFPAFPALTLAIVRSPDYDAAKMAFVRTVLNVSPPEMQTMIRDLLPPETVLLTDYGMTEGAGMITATPLAAGDDERLLRNGRPLPGIEVRITEPGFEDEIVAPDVSGEIQFRGVNALRGYYNDPRSTAETILRGGWVRTGDLGVVDANGSLLYLGRIKDILKVGGENVTPLEVEAHLGTHPAVQMAQVVGRSSERYGEEPVAFVELLPHGHADAEELIEYCRGHLASYKIPREVRFVTSWPMSATKIQKFRLKELLAAEQKAAAD
ncbi:class I adenylate-forming enzyme family protein [Rhodococcus sp. 14-2483-1-2]|uniref:class I adenylate-forming enzyme family protein n=1 Tax=Rhodococcus sp. 14-2483-1-2 TaxID=2023147 RepID=UPI00258852FE|nr:class I adenylate-forming enzyme family protein [Rhodococcus sp. 14-2483-1-2]